MFAFISGLVKRRIFFYRGYLEEHQKQPKMTRNISLKPKVPPNSDPPLSICSYDIGRSLCIERILSSNSRTGIKSRSMRRRGSPLSVVLWHRAPSKLDTTNILPIVEFTGNRRVIASSNQDTHRVSAGIRVARCPLTPCIRVVADRWLWYFIHLHEKSMGWTSNLWIRH